MPRNAGCCSVAGRKFHGLKPAVGATRLFHPRPRLPIRNGQRSNCWSESGLRSFRVQGAGLLLGVIAGVVAAAVFLRANAGGSVFAAQASQYSADAAESLEAADNPDARCAGCHRAIYEKYEQTPMAHASGAAADGLIEADFRQNTTGVEYRIRRDGQNAELTFTRPAVVSGGAELPALEGSRTLRYFIGSGLRGRTYLFETDGYWFEAPINWYARKQVWDMAPNFLTATEMPMTLPVDPGCLRCHASGAQPSLPQARNKYVAAPFLHGGILCEACHGDPSAHLASDGKTPMLEIDQLPAEDRDFVCLSCHMEGQAAIVHPGKNLENFRPGDSIWQYASFYVHASEQGSGGRATGQWEALLGSACKRASGDRMTCTTCHDPHGSDTLMTESAKVSWYRARCLGCHETPASASKPAFSAAHHPEQPDCSGCHMQRAGSTDIAHEQVTDHRIVARFAGKSIPPAKTGPLMEIDAESIVAPTDGRNPGLAYAQFAALGDREAYARALEILRSVAAQPVSAADAPVHSQLGFLEQVGGQDRAAAQEYEDALRSAREDAFAAGNLGLILARHGQPMAAVRLWRAALAANPAETATGINLATVDCALGDREDALAALEHVLAFAPDDRQALALEASIRSGQRHCGR